MSRVIDERTQRRWGVEARIAEALDAKTLNAKALDAKARQSSQKLAENAEGAASYA